MNVGTLQRTVHFTLRTVSVGTLFSIHQVVRSHPEWRMVTDIKLRETVVFHQSFLEAYMYEWMSFGWVKDDDGII